jgi:hypothetical protein
MVSVASRVFQPRQTSRPGRSLTCLESRPHFASRLTHHRTRLPRIHRRRRNRVASRKFEEIVGHPRGRIELARKRIPSRQGRRTARFFVCNPRGLGLATHFFEPRAGLFVAPTHVFVPHLRPTSAHPTWSVVHSVLHRSKSGFALPSTGIETAPGLVE